MPLDNTEERSSGQDRWQERVLRLLLITLKRLAKSGNEDPRYDEICHAMGRLFPQYYLPHYALRSAIQLLCQTGIIIPDAPSASFRLTQAGHDFDLTESLRLVYGSAAAN